MRRIYCFFFGHDWGSIENVREQKIDGPGLLFIPFMVLARISMPKEGDHTCRYCNKKETIRV